MFNFMKKQQSSQEPKRKKTRRFLGASFGPNVSQFQVSCEKINAELRNDGIALILRARSLVKNNDIVSSFVQSLIRSVLGPKGFQLNVTAYNEDGTSDRVANSIIEEHWYQYTQSYKKWLTASQTMNDRDFDAQVLFSLVVDGEAFIHKVKDPKSKYGIRWELIDALSVDYLYNELPLNRSNGVSIVNGVEVDAHFKPLAYWIRQDNADFYLSGPKTRVPASEIIHVYKPLFAGQTRGITALAPVMLNLNSLETYKRSEIESAILASVFTGMYEKTSQSADSYDDYDEDQINEKGEVATTLEAGGTIKYAPDGYNFKQVNVQHPNSNMPAFLKSLYKEVSASLGLSYNRVTGDYESTSYSSLKQANNADMQTVQEWQYFLIRNWKDIQYAQWLKYLLLSDLTNLPYSKIDKFLSHDFQGAKMPNIDEAKQIAGIQSKLSLGLSSPIDQIHNLGKDPVDVLNSWKKWGQMLADRGLKMNDLAITDNISSDEQNNIDDTSNENDIDKQDEEK